jgi:hypothetical protein
MSFESRVVAFSERFLSRRSVELIITPALADLQFERECRRRTASRLAVIRAVAGAVRADAAANAGMFVLLTLVPASYYFVLLAVCFDFFSGSAVRPSVIEVASPLLVMSIAPAMVCFWPERRPIE